MMAFLVSAWHMARRAVYREIPLRRETLPPAVSLYCRLGICIAEHTEYNSEMHAYLGRLPHSFTYGLRG